jgi:ABC-type spermidine/putrescine transport system permease subunit II
MSPHQLAEGLVVAFTRQLDEFVVAFLGHAQGYRRRNARPLS